MRKSVLMASLFAMITGTAFADTIPDEVTQAAEKIGKNFGIEIKDLRQGPAGFYEGRAGSDLVYFDAAGKHIIVGQVIEVDSGRNLTMARKEELQRFDPAAENKKEWTFSVGKGDKTIYVFTDPACPYCKKFEPELEKLTDVSIVYVPLAFQRSDDLVAAVLCSMDRVKAWKQAIRGEMEEVKFTPSCKKQMEEIRDFAVSKGINGTPTTVLPSGERINGYMPVDELKKRI